MHQQLWGYKVEEKLHVGVREQKKVEYHCYMQQPLGFKGLINQELI
jgi:hypothetical protein